MVEDVLCRIGTMSYTPEWSNTSAGTQIDDIIESSTAITVAANNMLAQKLEDKIVSHFRKSYGRRKLKIMDVGVGFGNTIVPVLNIMEDLAEQKKIPSDYMDYLQIFLVDVSEAALNFTFSRLTSKIPELRALRVQKKLTPVSEPVMEALQRKKNTIESFVKRIPINFADIAYNEELRQQKENIDIIVSGAAFCHQTDMVPFFEELHTLLRPEDKSRGIDGGVLHAWDWYNGPSWAAPRLRLSKDHMRRAVYYVKDPAGVLHVKRIEEDVALCGRERQELYKALECAEDMQVIYEITDMDTRVVLANFRTLLGVLGYVKRDESGRKYTRRIRTTGESIDSHLISMFAHHIENDHGFSYFDDFLKTAIPALDEPRPFKEESAYYLIEGYGDNYSEAMKRAGFGWALDEPFVEVYHRYKAEAGRELTGMVPVDQIRYTEGRRLEKSENE
jgi:SAM-dependent methyltransferase